MKLTFENTNSKFQAENLETIEEIYDAIRAGLLAMTYHKETTEALVEELKKGDDE